MAQVQDSLVPEINKMEIGLAEAVVLTSSPYSVCFVLKTSNVPWGT
jgi:hypothetical protein